jgi:hypothetical protein
MARAVPELEKVLRASLKVHMKSAFVRLRPDVPK